MSDSEFPATGDSPEAIKQKKELIMAKLQRKKSRIAEVINESKTEGFKNIQQALMFKAEKIERSSIWIALRMGDEKLKNRLFVEHEGIARFFHAINVAELSLRIVNKQIEIFASDGYMTPAEEILKNLT